jgi:hypothetical protein
LVIELLNNAIMEDKGITLLGLILDGIMIIVGIGTIYGSIRLFRKRQMK